MAVPFDREREKGSLQFSDIAMICSLVSLHNLDSQSGSVSTIGWIT